MLWSFVLPFEITLLTLAIVIASVTLLAPKLKVTRVKAFILSSGLAFIAFIPLCGGILHIAKDVRFGFFEYETFSQIEDFKVDRYVPPNATQITIYKEYHSNGYRARYFISESDFRALIESLWAEHKQTTGTDSGQLVDSGSPVSPEDMSRIFGDLKWKSLSNAVVYSSPSESDGGGATYYFDSKTGIVFQQTAYW